MERDCFPEVFLNARRDSRVSSGKDKARIGERERERKQSVEKRKNKLRLRLRFFDERVCISERVSRRDRIVHSFFLVVLSRNV